MGTRTKTSARRAQQRTNVRQQQARRQKLIAAVVGVGVLAFAVLIAVLSAQDAGSGARVDDLAGAPRIDGELPTTPDAGEVDPALDTPAPRVEGAGFDGIPVSIGEPGTPQVLMFVASWCEACRQELPMVVDWLDEGGLPSDVEFTTVVTWLDDARPNWPPDAWLEAEGYTGRVLVDDADGSVAAAYGQPATPFWVALDADGDVVSRSAGMLSTERIDQLATSVSGG